MEKKVVASLDLTDRENLLNLTKKIKNEIFAVKINWPTILSCGVDVISDLSQYARVICDLKIADIPNTNRMIMEIIRERGPFAVIAHSFQGMDSIKALMDASESVKVIGVVSMSNQGASRYLNPLHDRILNDLKEVSVYGIIAPGNDYELLGEIAKNKDGLKIFSPGIGAQGGSPVSALVNGADYVIIGRSIYNSTEPVNYVRTINEEIEKISN
ncbi:MAG: orotidine-5'-phosphate decarboxylase [Candidatus Thermoplasmatota archaeon]|jgi:orotidine-5'-phosphate decarboxylase|nr:orotidine-5'-phosphate decarboxylase [Candidatus Thermoplasmatota archaeon]MCL5791042.1 orotidine-5'-phosphate decarboxylase [Candidatus Thermoplasmatota archaeon]